MTEIMYELSFIYTIINDKSIRGRGTRVEIPHSVFYDTLEEAEENGDEIIRLSGLEYENWTDENKLFAENISALNKAVALKFEKIIKIERTEL